MKRKNRLIALLLSCCMATASGMVYANEEFNEEDNEGDIDVLPIEQVAQTMAEETEPQFIMDFSVSPPRSITNNMEGGAREGTDIALRVEKPDGEGGTMAGLQFGGPGGAHYFTLSCNGVRGGRHVAKVKATYFDLAASSEDRGWRFEYSSADRSDSSPWGSYQTMRYQGTEKWVTTEFMLTDFSFYPSLNGFMMRIDGTNGAGIIINRLEITLLESTPPENPVDVAVTAVSHDSVTLTWGFALVDNVGGVPSRNRTLTGVAFYEDQNGTDRYLTETTPVTSAASVPVSFKIGGLEPNTNYKFKLKNKDNNTIIPGESTGTIPIEVKTLDWSFDGDVAFGVSSLPRPPIPTATLSPKIKAINYSSERKPMTLIVALYEGDRMLSYVSDKKLVSGEEMLQTSVFSAPPTYVVRSYLWDDIDNMKIMGPTGKLDSSGRSFSEWKIAGKDKGQVTIDSLLIDHEKINVIGGSPSGAAYVKKNAAIVVKNDSTGEVHYIAQAETFDGILRKDGFIVLEDITKPSSSDNEEVMKADGTVEITVPDSFGGTERVTRRVIDPGRENGRVDLTNVGSNEVNNTNYRKKLAPGRSNDIGKFEFDFSMNDSVITDSGIYTVTCSADDASVSQGVKFIYAPIAEREALVGTINISTASDIKALLIDNVGNQANRLSMQAMDMRMDGFDALIDSNKTRLCEKILSSRPAGGYIESDDLLRRVFNQGVAVLLFEQTRNNTSATQDLLDSYQKDVLGFKTEAGVAYDKLAAAEREWVARIISERSSYSTIADVEDIFKEAVSLNQINKANIGNLEERMEQNTQELGLTSYSDYNYYKGLDSAKGKAYVNDIIIRWLDNSNNVYTSATAFRAALSNAVASQRANSNTGSGTSTLPNTGGGSSGGGRTSSIAVSTSVTPTPSPSPTPSPTPSATPDNGGQQQTESPTPKFDDIDGVEWATESIIELAKRNVINGMQEGIFAPNANITREQFIKILLEAFAMINADAICDFEDVQSEGWYYPYVASAVELGITHGMGDNRFGIGAEVTRQEVAVFAYRATLRNGMTLAATNQPIEFADQEDISDYAIEAITAMQTAGIINGIDGSFVPNAPCTRAQAAKIIYELLKISEMEEK